MIFTNFYALIQGMYFYFNMYYSLNVVIVFALFFFIHIFCN